MNRFKAFAILAAGLALAAPPLAAQDAAAPKPAPTLTAAEEAAVQQALDLGYKLHAYDQAAWHGTDAALEDLSEADKRGIGGWIVNEVDDGWETVFFRPVAGGGFEAAWSGIYDGETVTRRKTYAAGERPLTASEVTQVEAVALMRQQKVERCAASRFNTVVFPTGKPDGGFYAYLLTPQEKTGAIPFGGHHRFEIVNGAIKDRRSFTQSCLTMTTAMEEGKDGRAESLMVTHLLDPVPTEIHVFSVYAAKMPVYVLTQSNERVWVAEVSGGQPRIRVIR